MGSDLCEREQRIIELVSIHAPAWGATGRRSLCRGHRSVLTHAPTRGATWDWSLSSLAHQFQPTLPHGERLLTHDATLRAKIVSIHAPAWGATRNKWKCNAGLWFQPTLPHGERHVIVSSSDSSGMFQPTLPHGERLSPSIFLIFN